MKPIVRALTVATLAGASSLVHAQAVSGGCPQLPADSGLTWEYKAAASTEFCRALRADGSEAFGLYIAKDSAFQPGRANRAEEAVIDGRPAYWYRTELAGKPDVQARETLVKLPDGRVAYLWVQARTPQELGDALQRANSVRFNRAARVAGN